MESRKLNILKAVIFALFLAGIAAAAYFLKISELFDQAALQASIKENYALGVLIYILIAIPTKMLMTPSFPTSIVAGYLFGGFEGTVISMGAVLINSSFLFFAARYFGSGFVDSWVEKKAGLVKKYKELAEERGFLAILLVRAVPVLPDNVLNLIFGLSKISYLEFLLGTAVGALPWVFLLANIGHNFVNYSDPRLYIYALLYFIFAALAGYLGKKLKRKEVKI